MTTRNLAIAAVILLCVLWTGRQQAPATPKQNIVPATDQPAYDSCRYVGRSFTTSSGDLIDIDNLIAEEKKLPNRVTFLIEDQSLADGFLALESFAQSGIATDHFAINTLGQELHNECQARVSDESTIIALQNQISITKLAEGQASEQTIMSIAGHLSRKMLERYSHIRLAAKRAALDAIATLPSQPVFEGAVHQNVHQLPAGDSAQDAKLLN